MRYSTILLFGAPGSGKGTQGKILGTIPGYYHCSCGDVFRRLRPETKLGRTFLQYSSQGKLVPDEFTVQLWSETISADMQSGRFHPEHDLLVLDGLPRNRRQAEILTDTLDVLLLLNLACADNSKLVARLHRRALKENRLDDANLDVIQNRFETYQRETGDVLNFYPKDIVRTIDATQSPIRVHGDIIDLLYTLERQPHP